jgi:hypothetical protein
VTQAGLGLPSRDCYLSPDPAFAKVREEYAKTRAELEAFVPGFPWAAALRATGIASQDRFVVKEADAGAAMKATNAPEADQYLRLPYRAGWELPV